ncbi:hypothetical protein [Haloflavibacter putidus]|uniref:Uncharacterized protein n=1 Tax=Haloflavibacter putidus TaxID=2576776 RepID=A0A507ZR49_9FLAO|nr:hypothetical protein [Haloflavibacter putidus]TQD40070.1 hypothetical protein FKR84_02415 [Haloflavibacter putidus]
MKLVIQLLLWIVIGFLGYLTFNAVYEPIQFDKQKEIRYQKVIDRLKDIRKAELAYKEVTGRFAGNFESLITFVDTADFTITQRRDTSYLDKEYQKTYGVDKMIQDVVVDTIGTYPVKDSIFKESDRYKKMMYVPTTDKKKFDIDAGSITKNETKIAVFEVKVPKRVILEGLDEDLIAQEEQVISVDGVNGKYIRVGSMNEINTSGNWPKVYGANDE